ncbi:MAG: MFS transporter [Planctomycetes bacterium]|nr:MFS transporter [Planctomycetota bacterium]
MSDASRDRANPYESPAEIGHSGEPPTRRRYVTLAAFCAVAMFAYMARNSIGVAEQPIREELDLTKDESAWLMVSFFITYAIFQLPTGWWGHVRGTRVALPVYAVVWSLLTAAFAFSGGLIGMIVARAGMGIPQAGIFPCAVNSLARWIPASRRSISNGLMGAFMSVGGAAGGAIMGVMLGWDWSWRVAYALFSLPGLIWAGWFFFWFRNRPQDHPAVNQAELEAIGQRPSDTASEEAPPATPWRAMLSSFSLWALCGQQFFRAAGYIFFASWFATFLRETRDVDDAEVGILNGLPLLAVVIGSPLGGIFSDWIFNKTGSLRWSRGGVAAVSMMLCCGMILLSYPIANPWLAVLVISGGSFFAAFGGPCAYSTSIDMGGRHTAMVFSVMNMAGNVGAVLFPLAVPQLLKLGGEENWDLVLFTFAAIYVAAAVCWLLVDPTRRIDPDGATHGRGFTDED